MISRIPVKSQKLSNPKLQSLLFGWETTLQDVNEFTADDAKE